MVMYLLQKKGGGIVSEEFTEDDLDNCWPHHKAYFVDVLNKEYDLDEAISDLKSLVGSKHDPRKNT